MDEVYNVDDFLKMNEIDDAIKIFHDIEDTFHPIGMNPNNKKYPPNIFFVESNIDNRLFKSIQYAIKDRHRASIIHIGNKGSGKTISQNILLYRKNKDLEELGIFWVRCDSHKLYNLWRKQSNQEKLPYVISIQEYLDIQMVYVLCKYYKQNTFFQKIFEKLKSDEIEFNLPMSHHIYLNDENKKSVLAYKYIEKLNSEIIDNEKNNPQKNYSYAVDKIMFDSFKSTKQRAKQRWLDLSNCLQSYLRKKDYLILFIVDGIDNVNLTIPASQPMYIEMKSQFADFVRKRPKNDNYIHLSSLRTRTLNEMQCLITESSDTFHYSNPKNLIYFKQDKFDFTVSVR